MKTLLFSSLFLFAASLHPLQAQLPILHKKPWLGYFAGYDRNKFAMGVNYNGTIELEIKDKKGTRMAFKRAIIFAPYVIAEGEKGWYPLDKIRESMSTTDKPTDQPELLTYRGKVTGGAEYEVVVEFDRDKVSFGGKIVDKGETKKPIKFQMRCKFQQPYHGMKVDKKITAQDFIKFVKVDKKKDKCGIFETINFANEDTFGPLSSLEVQMKNYMNYGLTFSAEGNVPLTLENPYKVASPPMEGFVIVFEHDPEKDPQALSRMVFELK
jgi:hypothetical protein